VGEYSVTGETRVCVTIMITDASQDITTMHDRMPAILGSDEHEAWLAGEDGGLLRPYPGQMVADPPPPGS
jgi:putative SOS response-associated peptidase YedK